MPRAIDYFLRQDYTPAELIIVDDGEHGVEGILPFDQRIRYVRLGQRQSVGAKRNIACQLARGELIAHWDDDDWYSPHRLTLQVDTLLGGDEEEVEVCGLSRVLYHDLLDGRGWLYVYPARQSAWLGGGTLLYRRAAWRHHPFAEIDVGEDAYFVSACDPRRVRSLVDNRWYVGSIHDRNVSPKLTAGPEWQAWSSDDLASLLGDDWLAYHPSRVIGPGFSAPPTGADDPISSRAMRVAMEADLRLPEFGAFNYGVGLPRMRRWELPFAVFQAQLSSTMAVLDCTLNPAGLQQRLGELYPDVIYRHVSPIQNGRLCPPIGAPDAAFDRIVCINTLEHLLRPQREALVAAMARKLKPGGRLILTCDYYFDTFWTNPDLLRSGLVRADRAEVFNGWNRVTPHDWVSLCKPCGLEPIDTVIAEPRRDEVGLYLNREPFAHACIGGVFSKGAPVAAQTRRVLLALLTWNTSAVSIDSAQALAREARMLQRLGHTAAMCVCDNGSTDGLADDLRWLDQHLDVPHQFIFNRENRGNSVARNQIIQYARDWAADYVLFIDGDIEVVPFSSFAMLRYMENQGHELGCIGADSSGHTPLREAATPYLYSIGPDQIESTNLVAWTQYGMFRRAVFDDGVRFDESGPFNGAGWGFEDNDLAFQMELRGYVNRRFFGMTYLHRDIRSSIRIMRERGIDAGALYAQRKQYVIDKWAPVPQINNGPLAYVRRVEMVV